MGKAWQITLKDLRITFSNRNVLLLMFAAPLLLSAIIGITFGGVMTGSAPVTHIPVAIVSLDEGSPLGLSAENDTVINYGSILTELFTTGTVAESVTSDLLVQDSITIDGLETSAFTCPTASISPDAAASMLDELIDGTVFATPEEARAAVRSGEYAAAVIVPASFSADLSVAPMEMAVVPTTIELYSDPEKPISAQIVRSVLDQTTTQFATGNVTLAALTSSLPSNPLQIAAIITSPAFAEGIACAFSDVGSGITIERQTPEGDETVVDVMVVIGAGQALFFALFTANAQAGSIINERRNWTLQRMMATPTPAVMVLLGKIMAVFVIVFLQVLILCLGLTVLASLIGGAPTFIWGSNVLGVLVTIVATAFATAGIGSITAAVAKSEEQANTVGGIVALFMAVVGGSFGFTLPSFIGMFSIITWGREAFMKLAAGNNDILLELFVLLVFGTLSFGIGFVLFRRTMSDR